MIAAVSVVDWICLSLVIAMLLIVFSTRAAVARIEARIGRQLNTAPEPASTEDADKTEREGEGSAFEQFLAEDPERLAMSKKDQSAAYREWRKVKGMNWSG